MPNVKRVVYYDGDPTDYDVVEAPSEDTIDSWADVGRNYEILTIAKFKKLLDEKREDVVACLKEISGKITCTQLNEDGEEL